MIVKLVQSIFAVFYFIRKRFAKNQISEKVAVLSFHKLGDTVFTFPAIEVLYKKYGTSLTVFCYTESEKIYKEFFHHNDFIGIPRKNFILKRFANKFVRKEINSVKPKKIYDITSTIQTASIIHEFKNIEIIGFENPPFNCLYTKTILKRIEPTLPDMYLELDIDRQTKISVKENYFDVKINHSNLILIDPFAGWKAKEWGIDNFIAMTKKIEDHYNCVFIFEKKKGDDYLIENLVKAKINFVQIDDLEELFYYIRKAFLFIGNDSGPVNIARAFGVPTFTIYGPTNPDYTLAKNQFHFKYFKKINCSPDQNQKFCAKDGGRKGCGDFRCLNKTSVDEIYHELKKIIKAIKAKQFTNALEKQL